jgi:hypothetical protein
VSYLLDADVFIRAKNLHYGLEFCPAFWDWLVHSGNTGRVFSIDKVADEIAAGDDELTEWARANGQTLFRRTPPTLVPQFVQLTAWVTSHQFSPAAINEFLQAADYYLIAHAMAGGHIVVTHEVAAPSANRVKIPNACLGVNVRFMTPYQMLRIEKARFVLGTRA